MNVLAALTRLRQCACHPGLVDKSLLAAERSGKLDLRAPHARGHRRLGPEGPGVLVVHRACSALVRTRLELGPGPLPDLLRRLRPRSGASGSTDFQTADGGKVFLISIKAGGAGLNLTAADYVFLIDPWWNPAAEAQAIDRAHRMGRTRPVHVYRVLTDETVEARVVELQDNKTELSESVLSGATTNLASLSPADLGFLLS